MKKILAVLTSAIIILTVFCSVSAFAQGDTSPVEKAPVMDNDIFYAELPAGYKLDAEYDCEKFYFENDDMDSFEFYVEGNILLPDGIAQTADADIQKRVTVFYEMDNTATLKITSAQKKIVNGFATYLITAQSDDGLTTQAMSIAVFTTVENVIIIAHKSLEPIETYNTADMTALLNTYTMNGTYFKGDKPTLSHSFDGAPRYYDVYESEVLPAYTGNESFNSLMFGFVGLAVVLFLVLPVVCIVLIVLLVKSRKDLNQYKKYYGPIGAVRAPQMPAQGQYTYYGNQPYGQPPYGQPPYGQRNPYSSTGNAPAQPAQPAQPYSSQPYNNTEIK